MNIVIERIWGFGDICYVDRVNKLLTQLTDSRPLSRKEFTSAITNLYTSWLLAAKNISRQKPDDLVGMGLIIFMWRPEGYLAEIHSLVVDEEYREQGIGGKLIEKLLEVAKERAKYLGQKIPIYLTSRPSRRVANKLYQRHNFRLIAKARGEDGTNLYKVVISPQ